MPTCWQSTPGITNLVASVRSPRNVALNRGGVAADRGDGLLQLALAPAGNKNACAFLGEHLAMPRPIPALPPVTSATLPDSLLVIVKSPANCATPMAASTNVLAVVGSASAAVRSPFRPSSTSAPPCGEQRREQRAATVEALQRAVANPWTRICAALRSFNELRRFSHRR